MIYEPREDSFLLRSVLRAHAKGACIDIGTGSGILAAEAAKYCDTVIGVDIDEESLSHCTTAHADIKNLSFKQSDLFAQVSGKFDTIIFNPPYLPEDKSEAPAVARITSGGKKGHELSERFLRAAYQHLNPSGSILFLFSSMTGMERIHDIIDEELLDYKLIATQKLDFETLYVYRITKHYVREQLEMRGIHTIAYLAKGKRGIVYTGIFPEPVKYLSARSQDVTDQYMEFKDARNVRIAVKVQRRGIDAQNTVNREAEMLKRINKENIGPRFILAGLDYFIMTYIDGKRVVAAWEKADRLVIRTQIRSLLHQLRVLDILRFNKDEMTLPIKHIIIQPDGSPVLIDFERCKPTEKPHNITQFCAFLAGPMTHLFEKKHMGIDGPALLDLCQAYVESKYAQEIYERILAAFKEEHA